MTTDPSAEQATEPQDPAGVPVKLQVLPKLVEVKMPWAWSPNQVPANSLPPSAVEARLIQSFVTEADAMVQS